MDDVGRALAKKSGYHLVVVHSTTMPGSVGQYYWGGAAGTTFWVDPAERLFAVMMIQSRTQRNLYRALFRDMVYAAITD